MLLPLYPLHRRFKLKGIAVTHLQAISGAGEGFHLEENLLPFIEGEEEKTERETLKILGESKIAISTHCVRVPVPHGHMATVSASFETKPTLEEVREAWESFEPLDLPTAPTKNLIYFEEPNRPQPALDVDVEGGMAVALGRLRLCPLFDIRFTALSHNLIRGAAGGGLLTAEQWRMHAAPLCL